MRLRIVWVWMAVWLVWPAGHSWAARFAIGQEHGCALTSSGGVKCWGRGMEGQLGYGGFTTYTTQPFTVVGVSGASALVNGYHHSCALLADGRIKCWGHNTVGQVGAGNAASTFAETVPVAVAGITGAVAIASHAQHSCALLADTTVKCWGLNDNGQLGRASPASSTTPLVVEGLTGVVEIAVGAKHSCARLSDFSVRCWGRNSNGQLGDGSFVSSPSPVAVIQLSNVLQLAAGGDHSCALLSGNGVKCWGANLFRQLGNNSQTDSHTPVSAAVMEVQRIALGATHSCAITTSDTRCWGSNRAAQVGPGVLDGIGVPAVIAGLPPNMLDLALGVDASCAIAADGVVSCWGSNRLGQLGSLPIGIRTLPVETFGLPPATAVAVKGANHSCAIVDAGEVRCWGLNRAGQLGDGSQTDRLNPVTVANLSGATRLATGLHHSCAVIAGGQVRCWGGNDWGQLGNGSQQSSPNAVAVSGLSNVIALVATELGNCALVSGGEVRCWGSNSSRQLGTGSTAAFSSTPVIVTGASGAIALGAGSAHYCAVMAEGNLRCWGRNNLGQLGDGSNATAPTPVDVVGIDNATAVDGGLFHSCALLEGGGASCWGGNFQGQLGDGSFSHSNVPVMVQGLGGATALGVGANHSCALLLQEVRCWGNSDQGQIGDGLIIFRALPTPVLGLQPADAIAIGSDHNCAWATAGVAHCWGSNRHGELGNGEQGLHYLPQPVLGTPFITFELRYQAGPRGTLLGEALQIVDRGTSGSAVTASANAGYAFLRWSDNQTANPRTDTNVQGNILATAVFNALPAISAAQSSPATIYERESGTITISASDEDPGALAYAFDCNADGQFEIGPQAAASAVCSFPLSGLRSVGVRAIDTDGGSADSSLAVSVSDSAPVAGLAPPSTTAEDAAIPLGASASVPSSGEQIALVEVDCDYDGSNFVADLSATSAAALASCPGFPTGGARTLAVRARDDEPQTGAIATASLTVTAINDPPQFSLPVNSTSALEDAPAVSLNGWLTAIAPGPAQATDESGQLVGFEVVSNSNPALFAALPAISSHGTLGYTPAPDANGSATIAVRACDNGPATPPNQNCSATQSFSIHLTAVNDAPTMTVGADPQHPAASSGAQSVASFASFTAGPADEVATQQLLAYSLQVTADPAGVLAGLPTIASNGNLQYALTGVGGIAQITVSARDNGGTANGGVDLSAPVLFRIRVDPGADLEVVIDNHLAGVQPGQTTQYNLVASNLGPNAVTGARLRALPSQGLVNPAWTCVQAQSTATCPVPGAGSGAPDVLINLGVNQHLRFDLLLDVAANASGTVAVAASIEVPAGVTGLVSGNDNASDTDPVLGQAVFANGFENAGGAATLPAAEAALRAQ